MKSLFIDTSSSNLVLAIVNDNKIVSKYISKVNNEMSVHIFPQLDNIFKHSKMVPNDIDTIFVVNGPGSFTGIRVGLTIAKVYAWSLKKKIVPISSLELMASTNIECDYIVSLIDARRNYVFAGIYDNNLNQIIEDKHILLEDFLNEIPGDKKVSFVSYDEFNLNSLYKPDLDIIKVIAKHENDSYVNPHSINPNYLKLTEAEENFNRKKSDD